MKLDVLAPSAFWLEAWEQARSKNERTADDQEEEKYWQAHAMEYDEKNPLAPYASKMMEEVYKLTNKTDTLLEIGPGTGGFTTLLAPKVKEMIVVEPSQAMYHELQKNWQNQLELPLPTAIHSKWEEAPELKVDIVFGVNAFYRMRDMKACLQKMHRMTRRHVILIQSMGKPFADPLEVEMNGERHVVERANAIAHILAELKIKHEFKSFPVTRKNGMTHEVALIHWTVH